MMTGLYPAGHGVHENARAVDAGRVLVAARLKQSGYATAAIVSSYVLARQFGLAQGFDVYDDLRPTNTVERAARDTTDRAVRFLAQAPVGTPLLIWVHYFDPHTPYAPPEPYASRLQSQHPRGPYLGEIGAMDAQLGRLIQAFEQHAARAGAAPAVLIAG